MKKHNSYVANVLEASACGLGTNASAVSASSPCLILHLRYFHAFERHSIHIKCTSNLLSKSQMKSEYWVSYS